MRCRIALYRIKAPLTRCNRGDRPAFGGRKRPDLPMPSARQVRQAPGPGHRPHQSAEQIPNGEYGDDTHARPTRGSRPRRHRWVGIPLPSAILTCRAAYPVKVVRPVGRSTLTG
jgi:hypothetical protein